MKDMEKEMKRTARKYAKKRGKGKETRGNLAGRPRTNLSSYSDDDRTPPSTQMRGAVGRPTGY